jgi:hypothetical protein
MWQGDLVGAIAQFNQLAAEANAARDVIWMLGGIHDRVHALAYHGDTDAATAAANTSIDHAGTLSGWYGYNVNWSYAPLVAALAAGDAEAAAKVCEAGGRYLSELHTAIQNSFMAEKLHTAIQNSFMAEAASARGDLAAARRWADSSASITMGFHRMLALTTRARIALRQGQSDQAECDAHDALALGANLQAHLLIPDILECLAVLAAAVDSHQEAARLCGAAAAIRRRIESVRFKIYDADYEASIAALRDALGDNEFEAAWAEGAALSTEEAIASAQRGRGER